MRVLKKSLAMAIIVSLLTGIVLFGSQMENGQFGRASAVQAKTETKDYKYKSSTLKVKRGKKTIYGKIFQPISNKEKKFPTVIYSHGFGGSYEYGVDYAKALAKKGYAVYCFDFCGGAVRTAGAVVLPLICPSLLSRRIWRQ